MIISVLKDFKKLVYKEVGRVRLVEGEIEMIGFEGEEEKKLFSKVLYGDRFYFWDKDGEEYFKALPKAFSNSTFYAFELEEGEEI